MQPWVRNYALPALAIVAAVLIYVFTIGGGILDNFALTLSVLFFPVGIIGLYMYAEGKGYKNINGVDWSAYTEQERSRAAAYMGKYVVISMVICCISLGVLFHNILMGIIVLVAGIIVSIYPIVTMEKGVAREFVPKSTGAKVGLFIVTVAACLVPSALLDQMDFTTDSVTVEFGDDGISLGAPFVATKTFAYDKIEELELDPDFDKGRRIMGYGTPYICSGTFENEVFGKYTLMSYTKVKPAVFFLYDGRYYAFNQADDEMTQQAYDTLVSKVGA